MTRATSVIDDCINKLKIRGKHKEKWAKTRKKGHGGKHTCPKKVVRRSPSCRTGNDGLGVIQAFHTVPIVLFIGCSGPVVGSLTVSYWFYLGTRLLGQNTGYKELCVQYLVIVVFVFNVPPTAKVIWRQGHSLKSHLTDWWSRESNLGPLVYKASSLSTTPQQLLNTVWKAWITSKMLCPQISNFVHIKGLGEHIGEHIVAALSVLPS